MGWGAKVALLALTACGRIGFDPLSGSGTGNGDGGADAPLPVGRWKTVATNGEASCAITLTGELWCAGLSLYGNLGNGYADQQVWKQVGTDTDWDKLAIGTDTYIVKTDGSLYAVGNNVDGAIPGTVLYANYLTPVRIGVDTWTHVAVNGTHGCGIRSDQTMGCWGNGFDGTLGTGSTAIQNAVISPSAVGVDRYIALTMGKDFACGIQTDNTLWCWGKNVEGRVGDGTTMMRLTPVQVGAGHTWVSVAGDHYHACAIEQGGQAWCWGDNAYGQLGDSSMSATSSPRSASAVPPLAVISVGASHSCGLTQTGHVVCWGLGDHGQLASTTQKSSTPIDLGAATVLATHWDVTCIVDDQARLFCAGSNNFSQGGPTSGELHQPTRADQRTDWSAIAAQGQHACGLAGGSVNCWGMNNNGQNGDGSFYDRKLPSNPGPVGAALAVGSNGAAVRKADNSVSRTGYLLDGSITSTWVQALGPGSANSLAEGAGHGCRIVSSALRCGGGNFAGQLGDMTTAAKPDVQVPGTWNDVWAGYDATCAITSANQLTCWGANNGGQLGIGSTTPTSTPTTVTITGATGTPRKVSFGEYFGCALMTSGEVWCAGVGADGQLATGGVADSTSFVRAGSASNYIDMATGDRHVCAIAMDHTLWCWGHADQGQIGPNLSNALSPRQVGTDTDWSAIATGKHFSCALKMDGTRWCMGVNGNGELGNGLGWNDHFAVIP